MLAVSSRAATLLADAAAGLKVSSVVVSGDRGPIDGRDLFIKSVSVLHNMYTRDTRAVVLGKRRKCLECVGAKSEDARLVCLQRIWWLDRTQARLN